MHNQNVRAFRELNEFWIGSVLIGAEDDRYIPGLHAIRQSRHVSMRYSQRSHCCPLAMEHGAANSYSASRRGSLTLWHSRNAKLGQMRPQCIDQLGRLR